MWDSKGCGVKRLQGKTLGPKIPTSEDPTIYIYIFLMICDASIYTFYLVYINIPRLLILNS